MLKGYKKFSKKHNILWLFNLHLQYYVLKLDSDKR